MVRAAAVLRSPRAVAAAAVLALLLAYYAFHRALPNLPTPLDVAFVGLVVIPAVFALVWLALPLREGRGLLPVGVAFATLAVVASEAELDVIANFAKLFAATAIAFWFLRYFESALWVALVALLIPFVDAYSVWRGPTAHIISERPEVFTALSFAFPLAGERQALVTWRDPLAGPPDGYEVFRTPGGRRSDELVRDENGDGEAGWLEAELDARRDYTYAIVAVEDGRRTRAEVRAPWRQTNRGPGPVTYPGGARAPTQLRVESVDSSAKLGLPDLLFFALFIAAAVRFRLRAAATWLLMAGSLALTLALTYLLGIDGLPALPLLAVGFLLPNADLLWRRLRAR